MSSILIRVATLAALASTFFGATAMAADHTIPCGNRCRDHVHDQMQRIMDETAPAAQAAEGTQNGTNQSGSQENDENGEDAESEPPSPPYEYKLYVGVGGLVGTQLNNNSPESAHVLNIEVPVQFFFLEAFGADLGAELIASGGVWGSEGAWPWHGRASLGGTAELFTEHRLTIHVGSAISGWRNIYNVDPHYWSADANVGFGYANDETGIYARITVTVTYAANIERVAGFPGIYFAAGWEHDVL